jgi:hypothetical protein
LVTTTFFKPVAIGPLQQKFGQGPYNNPVQSVYSEANQLWGDRINDALLITIGTGAASSHPFEGSTVDRVMDIVTQIEETNHEFLREHSSMLASGKLFKFNDLNFLAKVGLEEYKMETEATGATQEYLNNGEICPQYRKCLEQLHMIFNHDVFYIDLKGDVTSRKILETNQITASVV